MSSARTTAARWVAPIVVIGIASLAAASENVAIYTNIAGHTTAQVPGEPGEQFRSPSAPFLVLQHSPLGTHWIFKAFTDNPDSAANDVIVAGSGTTGLVVAKEGDPAPIGGLTYGFMDSDCGINDTAQYVFGNRLSGGPTTTDEVIFKYDGVSTVTAAREGDPAPGLFDPLGAGNELFGNSLNSAHILNDATAAFKADLIQNIHSDYESALYHGSTVVAQEGTTIGPVAGIDVYDSFIGLSGNTFSSSADGGSWIVEADILPGTGTVEAVVVDDNVQIRDGDILDASLNSPVDGIFEVDMSGGGDWFARGDLADDRDWVVRNGTVVAATGRPITPGNPELWANVLMAVNGNGSGDYVVVGDTSNPDPASNFVVVLNGQRIVARTGDPVILSGANVFIDSFDAFDVFISEDLNDDVVDDREVYVFAGIRDDAGTTIGDAFIVIRLSCPWDCGDSEGTVGVVDFLALLAQWGQIATTCDFDGDGVGVVDFLAMLAAWGPCT
ncbi:MAG: hypothetical protein ACYSUR_05435 [Planctomycetota bacterium]|jgi:hypothetical protein